MTDTKRSRTETIDLKITGRIALLLCAILSSFAQGGLLGMLPAIAAHFSDYPAAATLTRLLGSSIGVMIVFGSPFVGALADRHGRRRVILISLLLYSVAGCAGFFLDNLYLLLATRVLVGLATAAVGAIMLAMVVTHSEGTARNRWLGYINMSGVLCTIVLLPLAGWAGTFGWQWPFLIHAIALPIFVMAYIGLEHDAPAAQTAVEAAAAPRTLGAIPWKLLILAVAVEIVMATSGLFVPFHLRDIGITDPRRLTLALAPNLVGTSAAAFFYGAIRTRLSLEGAFIAGFAFAAAALLMMGLGESYTVVLVGAGLLGLSTGLNAPSVYAVAGMTGPDSHRAQTMGISKGALFTGPLIGQIALEPIVRMTDAGVGIVCIAAFAMLMLVIRVWQLKFRTVAAA